MNSESNNKESTLNIKYSLIEKAIISVLFLLPALVGIIMLLIDCTGYIRGSLIKNATSIASDFSLNKVVCLVCIAIMVSSIVFCAIAVVRLFIGGKFMKSWAIGAFLFVSFMIICSSFDILGVSHIILCVIGILSIVSMAAYWCYIAYKNGLRVMQIIHNCTVTKTISAMCGAAAVLSLISVFNSPFAVVSEDKSKLPIYPSSTITYASAKNESTYIFLLFFALLIVGFSLLISALSSYSLAKEKFAHKIKQTVYFCEVVSISYFIFGIFYCYINNNLGGNYSTSAYTPMIITSVITLIFAVISRNMSDSDSKADTEEIRKYNINSVILIIFVCVFTIVTFSSLMVDILNVDFTTASKSIVVNLNGYKILTDNSELHKEFQSIAFIINMFFTICGSFLLCTAVAFVAKSKLFSKIAITAIIANAAFALFIGLMGKYYTIAQSVNEEAILSLLGTNAYMRDALTFEYEATSQSFYLSMVDIVLAVLLIALHPYSKCAISEASYSLCVGGGAPTDNANNNTALINNMPINNKGNNVGGDDSHRLPSQTSHDTAYATFDACPAFSDIDSKIPTFTSELQYKTEHPMSSPTLSSLTDFIIDYAYNSRLHLSYSRDDIASFIAGLGMSRLTIIQGMSGTGKTSLPKIFSEAIMGTCDIVEVESSWRDKNELLGYYNEFSKIYTPKKFTQMLYKATLNPDVPTFIVLDEMNLSRIEYYFSDFLSLMENEEDKREIKLLNVKLANTYDGEKHEYKGLTDGYTIRIPKNVWFIGTANRDESTFEISDKVYDRANTINLNRRASKDRHYGSPLNPEFVPYNTIRTLIERAEAEFAFSISKMPIVAKIEQLLEPYNISFGNRVENQIDNFVKIYCSCFVNPDEKVNEAVEKIMLSKVVGKLELKSIENKEALALEFENLGLLRCSGFIRRLNEE